MLTCQELYSVSRSGMTILETSMIIYATSTMSRTTLVHLLGVLDDFLLTNRECKTSPLGHFNKLRRLSNNAFPHNVPVSSTKHGALYQAHPSMQVAVQSVVANLAPMAQLEAAKVERLRAPRRRARSR